MRRRRGTPSLLALLSFSQDIGAIAASDAGAKYVGSDMSSCGVPTDPPSSFNCSYNGACLPNGICACFPGWTGTYCHSLDLLPATNASGLNMLRPSSPENGARGPTSTWGGSVLWDDDTGLYHMYASEMSHHCGIHRWLTNSIVVRATSRGPPDGWSFVRREELLGLFAHEPIAARDPTTGEVAVFVTHYPGDASDCPTCFCSDGSSASGGPGCANECGGGENKTLFSYFIYASDAAGTGGWSNLTSLCRVQMGDDPACREGGNPHTDMNLAPVIRPDGSLLAWTRWNIWTATHWEDPSSYRDTGQAPDFNSKPYPTPWEGEDPSVWIDRDGHYHMISHNGDRGRTYPTNSSGDCGRHFFSTTGRAGTWRVAPLLPPEELGGCAYPREVPFEDGRTYTFYRRERPHVVFGPDGFTPLALSTAVIDCPDETSDASYTLVQPIKTNVVLEDGPESPSAVLRG